MANPPQRLNVTFKLKVTEDSGWGNYYHKQFHVTTAEVQDFIAAFLAEIVDGVEATAVSVKKVRKR